MARSMFSIIIQARNEAARALGAAFKQIEKLEGAVARTGKQAERATTGLRGMGRELERVGSKMPMLLGSGGLAYGLKKTADVAFQANAQMMVFERTVLAFGQSLEESRKILDDVAARLQVAPEQIAASASLMLRAGFNMKEVAAAFEAGAASALAAGKSVQSGIENVSLALSTGLSIYLNYIGIAENIGPVIRRAINAHKNAAPEIVRAAQNQAALNVVLKATAQEVKALPVLLGGYQGALNRLNVALFNLTKEVGKEVLPLLTTMIADLQTLVNMLERAPAPLKAFAVGVTGASVAVVALAGALAGLKTIVGVLGGPAGWLMLLASALGGIATVLYNRTIPAVGEGKKALERLAAAAAETKQKIHELNVEQLRAARAEALNEWMGAIRRLRSEFSDAGPAVQRFLDDLQRAGAIGMPLQGLEDTIKRIELLVKGLQATGRDIEAAPVLDFARSLITLRDYAQGLEDAQKQLEAYLEAANALLQNRPPPTDDDNDRLREYYELWEKINNLPIIKSSLLIKVNREMGRTADTALRNMQKELGRVVETMSTMSPDTFERLQNRIEATNDELRTTQRIVHTLFSTGALVTAPDTLERIAGHASKIKQLTEEQKKALEEANQKIKEQLELWRTIEQLPILKASYWKELAQAIGTTPDAMFRNSERQARRVVDIMSTMSPDTFDRLQSRLQGVKKEADEVIKRIQVIFASPAAQATSPDTLARIEEHAKNAKEHAKNLADANKRAREEAERLAAAYKRAADAAASINAGTSRIISAFKKAGQGDFKGAFSDATDAISEFAKMIPKIGPLISEAIQIAKTVIVSLWDAITDPTGARRAERRLNEVAKQYTLIGKAAFEAAKQTETLEGAGLFGVRRRTIVRINEDVLKIAQTIASTLESGVLGALRSGIMAFLKGKADWAQQLKDGIRDAIYNGIIEAVIQAGIIQGMLAEQFTALNKALVEQNWELAAQIAQGIYERVPEITANVEKFFGRFRLPGSEETGGKPTADSGLIYRLPEIPVVTTPSWVDQMGRAVAKFDRAVDRLLEGSRTSKYGLRGIL